MNSNDTLRKPPNPDDVGLMCAFGRPEPPTLRFGSERVEGIDALVHPSEVAWSFKPRYSIIWSNHG